ncbi:MAG: phosphotransferase [Streptosporangiaceae bacterium]
MPDRAPTHEVHVDRSRGVVTKRFRSWDRGEHVREWTALRLLAEHAPGLSPRPIRAGLAADAPVIEMSCLPGTPLGGLPLSALQAHVLSLTLVRLWTAVPQALIGKLTIPARNSSAFIAQVRSLLSASHDRDIDDFARLAFQKGSEWFVRTPFDRLADADAILGQGDPNLTNFLWDGTDVRIVDFEDAGPSSRAFELALLVEHVSAWSDSGIDADAFSAMFDLTDTELATLRGFRRLAALFWLLKLLSRNDRNLRDDALKRQAERLLTLLG